MRARTGRILSVACALAALAAVAAAATGASAESPCGPPTISPDGKRVYGSPCSERIVVTSPQVREVFAGEGDDVVYANPNVELVDGGPGDDVIYGELPETESGERGPPAGTPASGPVYEVGAPSGANGEASASIAEKHCEANVSCYGGDGSQELIGSSGDDKIFGQRGNDKLYGYSGDDELFGGIGDESIISGGAGEDLLSGGLGTDHLNGNQDSDLVRGDGTVDSIEDTGSSGTDTLSFATGVTPGFSGEMPYAGFPGEGGERGVSVRLDGFPACGSYQACDNGARYGGGNDEIAVSGFENVIGSPFADYIVGSNGNNRIDGGGGADVILGNGGDDTLYGGADGDYLKGDSGTDTVYGQGGTNHCDAEVQSGCSGSSESVVQRDTSKISVGFMATAAATNWVELYLTGSTGADRVTVSPALEGGIGYVTFATEGESAQFDTSSDAASEGCSYEATKVRCTLPHMLDALVLAGMGGADRLALSVGEQFWETTTPVLLGGEGSDELLGSGHTEDLLVDGNGSGNDTLYGYAYDDGLINNEGQDNLQGGNGNDLLLSVTNCEGDTLQGAEAGSGDGSAVNSASWAKYEGAGGIVADLAAGRAGNTWSSGPACSSGTVESLANIDDLEGSNGNDSLYGDAAANNLLGRLGEDGLWGREGADNIEAQDGAHDTVGGGPGTDTCSYDSGVDSVSGCP